MFDQIPHSDFNVSAVKKYELVPCEPTEKQDRYRIRALKDFGSIKKGDLGGIVSGEHNLSQSGNCWIHPPAFVVGSAHVSGNAQVLGRTGLVEGHISGDEIFGLGLDWDEPSEPHGPK